MSRKKTEEVVEQPTDEEVVEQPTGEPVAQEIHSDTATRQYHERNDAIKKAHAEELKKAREEE